MVLIFLISHAAQVKLLKRRVHTCLLWKLGPKGILHSERKQHVAWLLFPAYIKYLVKITRAGDINVNQLKCNISRKHDGWKNKSYSILLVFLRYLQAVFGCSSPYLSSKQTRNRKLQITYTCCKHIQRERLSFPSSLFSALSAPLKSTRLSKHFCCGCWGRWKLHFTTCDNRWNPSCHPVRFLWPCTTVTFTVNFSPPLFRGLKV